MKPSFGHPTEQAPEAEVPGPAAQEPEEPERIEATPFPPGVSGKDAQKTASAPLDQAGPGQENASGTLSQREYHSSTHYYSCSSLHTETQEENAGPLQSVLYTCVKTVKGVAIEWETEAGFEPVCKRPRVCEAEFVTQLRQERVSPVTDSISTSSRLNDQDFSMENLPQDHDETGTATPQETAEEVRETPDWLSTTDYGFRCMACCRVFPSLEALLQHAQHGVQEGFSCHVFYQEMVNRRVAQEEHAISEAEGRSQRNQQAEDPTMSRFHGDKQ
ncbi:protein FAM170B [Tachyglossus aculeatus]|uniref:protein FAM170B n=1 Tax=Tachyglossus aculeatus TaxID=9261 RepID=UPI0018F41B4D|nr:protein FAM170B [Tachyglossus aculeatus]